MTLLPWPIAQAIFQMSPSVPKESVLDFLCPDSTSHPLNQLQLLTCQG